MVTDVIIVGSGFVGLAAAIEAYDAGARGCGGKQAVIKGKPARRGQSELYFSDFACILYSGEQGGQEGGE